MLEDLSDIEALRAFPSRAKEVIALLMSEGSNTRTLEEWRSKQLIQFLAVLSCTATDLEVAYTQKRLATVAWLTRNLLELSIWIEFCNTSTDNAQRFRNDVLKDMHGLVRLLKAFDKLEREDEERFLVDVSKDIYGESYLLDTLRKPPEPEPEWSAVAQHLSAAGQSLGLVEISDDFTRVSEAAKKLGRGEYFLTLNKTLSKFAHPTSLVVYSTPSVDGGVEVFGSIGVRIAFESLTRILQFVSKTSYGAQPPKPSV